MLYKNRKKYNLDALEFTLHGDECKYINANTDADVPIDWMIRTLNNLKNV
jgi:hypothetical protein